MTFDEHSYVTRALDRRLTITAEIPGDDGIPATDGRHLALTTRDGQIIVSTVDGNPLWRRAFAHRPVCHLDGDTLWILAGDRLSAAHVRTGDPIGEIRLNGVPTDGEWIIGFASGRLGLTGKHHTFPSWLLHATADGVHATELPGERLLGFHQDGTRYLSIPGHPQRLTMRDTTTGAVLAARSDKEIGGADADMCRDAAMVSNALVIAGVEDISGGWTRHVLLCADTLQPRSVIDYPTAEHPWHIIPAAEPGMWVTSTAGYLHLWCLDGLLDDDPLPGQLSLF